MSPQEADRNFPTGLFSRTLEKRRTRSARASSYRSQLMPPIYLDNASTSWPKAPGVARALADAVASPLATPARGTHAFANSAARILSTLREKLAVIVGIDEPDRVVLTSGATYSLNLAVLGLLAHRADRPRVVTTAIEHNALRRPLESLSARGLIELVTVAADRECRVAQADVLDAINDQTALVAMSHASNVTGTLQPIEAVAAGLAARRGAGRPTPLFLLDASQTAGLVSLDAQRLGIDLVAFSGHKALRGPAGTGVLCVGPRAFDLGGVHDEREARLFLQPLHTVFLGGTGNDSEPVDMPDSLPSRYEPGTPNTPGFAGLLAAVEQWSSSRAAHYLEHERALVTRLRHALTARFGTLDESSVHLYGPPDPAASVPVLACSISGLDPADAAAALESSFDIIARAGLHCSPGAHAAMNTLRLGGTLRLSPGPETTVAEIEAAALAMIELARAANG